MQIYYVPRDGWPANQRPSTIFKRSGPDGSPDSLADALSGSRGGPDGPSQRERWKGGSLRSSIAKLKGARVIGGASGVMRHFCANWALMNADYTVTPVERVVHDIDVVLTL